MAKLKACLLAISLVVACQIALAQDEEPEAPPLQELPREQTLILQNPEGTIRNPGWFNLWVSGAGGGLSTGLQQLMMDTFWYIDPNQGIDGPNYNSLATGPAEYNDDYTEMTVRLREGVYWSDGVEFTADDVVYTVETQMNTPGMGWSGAFSQQVERVEALDDYTVRFTLNAPNSRFHSIFSVRWNGAWIMPKHIFEEVDNVLEYDFNPPVGLGPYTLHSFDPNGDWYIWEKREDWDRTAMAEFGEPAPQYVIYRNGGPTDRRLIEMRNGNLDVVHDLTPEGMFAIVQQDPTARGWFSGFPYAHPDPTLPMVIFNHQNEKFQDRRVRWALTLMLDARALSMASYRGAATLTAIAIPPTGTHPDDYHIPMQEWVSNFTLEAGGQAFQPYNPDLTLQIADMVRGQFGDQVPTDEDEIRRAFGYGWWEQNLEAAAALLEEAGFTRRGNDWYMPNGERFSIRVMIPPDGVINRLGTMIAQNWSQAGVAAQVEAAPDSWDRQSVGDFEVNIAWSIETWGGHPDLSFFLDSWHSQYLAEPGELQPARNWQRWSHPELDRIIEEVRRTDFYDLEANIELGKQFIQLMVEEMPVIPIMSYNVFSVVSERYWTGYPTAENPYANPVNNWANSRYILTQLESTQ
ncbi:ABC transporter substrate-binding protein [Truepera radiovictrix]|uniref:Extracellular solute-binding protein family 5 n=1 Tax=Truepera radiovictrix (strain DSM 17093 / CIP 108686 / LMG 22925 / RQ-24) TaxID=649638 RepID=D7CXT8_TRURR|nr:ABC transporter substrate-binding protein [Truepera radiovictrix]ADI13298.1 extracellular solute-binding protein family 5 [Truepera radiovictrix DSM 17093]WMT58138.1 ABC transporter substrate-binding protein [Truepera radiovictrix]